MAKQLPLTPMIVRKISFQAAEESPATPASAGLPGLGSDFETENKENNISSNGGAASGRRSGRPSRSASIRRRCSSYFTPLSKRAVAARLSGSVRTLDRSGGRTGAELQPAGLGRLIPIKQGYMYKKCGTSRLYRRKYVTLCSDSVMTYYPSFQAYRDNVEGKEIQLSHVTVKIPGKKPSGLKSSSEGSALSDECDKEDLTFELCLEPENVTQPCEKTAKRKRLSNPSEAYNELLLVSLEGSQWQFQLCTEDEVSDWEKAIQAEILNSLCKKEILNLDHIKRDIAGNSMCADCGAAGPDWASINLGILVCIECSGIHRNLGSHVSKVRSLGLDTWTALNIKTLENTGNQKANQFWERNMSAVSKPTARSSRLEKAEFIKLKYIEKQFCTFDYTEKELGILI